MRRRRNSVQQWTVPRFPNDRDREDATGTDFLLTDVDLALTFMDIADTTTIEETAHRNRARALQAYNSVLHFLSRPALRHIDRHSIEIRLATLKARLDAVGYGP
jgi:hypothetical protein